MTRPLLSQKLKSLTLDMRTFDMLKQYAHAARRPMTVTAAGIIADYLARRAEIGDGLPTVKDGQPRTPILHELFADLETRLAATLSGQSEDMATVLSGIDTLKVMVDKLALAFLLHAPEVPKGEQEEVKKRGERRHESWGASVTAEVQMMRSKQREY